jgi:L-seryl-tRNA(Ser) seleniumtransferase
VRELLRQIPKVDRFLSDKELLALVEGKPLFFLKKAVNDTLAELRLQISQGRVTEIDYDSLKEKVKRRLLELLRPKLHKVINATGVVLHTNLGRAPISRSVAEHLVEVITGYSNLEYDLEKGRRGLRYRNLEWILKELTGAEDVCVVNNNAGAVLLVLSALAKGKEVIVSRGELIEIGGSFRIPDVMAQSGAVLREVGTTNKTHLRDYEEAITEETALLMKVHTSNYKILGFTASVPTRELVELGRKYGVPVYEDLGSGSFIDVRKLGLSYEPTVQDVLKSGVDVVSFSGDKLLGGAQAGIILGRRELLQRIKRHPLNRALRIDKMTLAVLEATLVYYLEESLAFKEIPVWKLLSQPKEAIKAKAKELVKIMEHKNFKGKLTIIEDEAEVGGGALPLQRLPTYCVKVSVKGLSAEEIDRRMRSFAVPVVGRIKKDAYLLDMMTVFEEEIPQVAENLLKLGEEA